MIDCVAQLNGETDETVVLFLYDNLNRELMSMFVDVDKKEVSVTIVANLPTKAQAVQHVDNLLNESVS